eukprot:CAMPEP_0114557734 /NCGR_PEP_ID=MMETSP0114-20121206/9993_1 /TAXON_ID=31324 /ORGANISM="Goniomonas sp, Strain m" /LENGTH=271 /DNA_ID=CAMNT_0001743051 /DNA_START=56 /DNA_END=871 /DNA_ORIENTATION=-
MTQPPVSARPVPELVSPRHISVSVDGTLDTSRVYTTPRVFPEPTENCDLSNGEEVWRQWAGADTRRASTTDLAALKEAAATVEKLPKAAFVRWILDGCSETGEELPFSARAPPSAETQAPCDPENFVATGDHAADAEAWQRWAGSDAHRRRASASVLESKSAAAAIASLPPDAFVRWIMDRCCCDPAEPTEKVVVESEISDCAKWRQWAGAPTGDTEPRAVGETALQQAVATLPPGFLLWILDQGVELLPRGTTCSDLSPQVQDRAVGEAN